MELFFEEVNSQKLIRQQQVVLVLVLGFAESLAPFELNNSKITRQLKSALKHVHQNYLVFVEFICKNLTQAQKEKTHEWAAALIRILGERPQVKTYSKSNNSQTLKRNNELTINIMKSLCRTRGS